MTGSNCKNYFLRARFALLCVTTFSTFVSEKSALGAEHGVGEHVAIVVEVILAPLRLSTDYSPLLPKQSKIASPGIALGSGMKNQAIGSHDSRSE